MKRLKKIKTVHSQIHQPKNGAIIKNRVLKPNRRNGLKGKKKNLRKVKANKENNETKKRKRGQNLRITQATKKNGSNRRNPYFIYNQDKKNTFYKDLNNEYNMLMQPPQEDRQSNQVNPKPDRHQENEDGQAPKLRARLKKQTVQFEEEIQIVQFDQNESIHVSLNATVIRQIVNQEQNKME